MFNHPIHPNQLSPSGSGSPYSEQGRTILPPLTIAYPMSDSPVSIDFPNTDITVPRSTPVPYEPPYYPPAQQQQTHTPYYPSFQPLSEARYHSGQHVPYGRASPPSNLARPPPLDVPMGGRVQRQAYYPYHADLQTPRTSNDLRSHSVYSPASSIPQYQSPTSPVYPAGHSASQRAIPTVATANTLYQQSLAMSYASFDLTMYQDSRAHPYARAPIALSPVPYDVPPETQEPTIKKKRKRADARQLDSLNTVYARTASPSTEERQQLASDLDLSARAVQIWLAHTFVYTRCIFSELSTILSGSKTKGRYTVKPDEILSTARLATVNYPRMIRILLT
ncbi:hypothetical protein DFH94DRAFT_71127 [Russula ochroleuca]|jgi:homeobox protein YOX1/YHP1|uniref:Homeobox domain-containing protein n=1 Tax=Russula ochroleuca TaxID=152965 RepID=A0A9P5JUW0_9AGAM|nr:hypothetical protein DFH94DRAFT_71127 [Russula ochroleuca]